MRSYLGFVLLAALLLGGVAPAQTPPVEKKALYALSDFGPTATPAQVKAAYEAAIAQLGKTGGLLIIPTDIAKQLAIENTTQISPRDPAGPEETKRWQKAGPGITIVEVNETGTVIKVPQAQGLTIERTLRMPLTESLPHWSTDFAFTINNTLLHGSNSYLDWIPEPVKAGKDARFYVKTIRGIRVGMFLNLHGGPGYGGGVTRGCVKSIGYDPEKKLWYFTADTSIDHVAGAIVQNKNNEGVIFMTQKANCDEQTYDVMLRRQQYALGDTYMYFGWFDYMSNIHSAAGDENGNIFAGYSHSKDNCFTGTVDTVDWTKNALKFAGGVNQDTLGQSRALINMNKAKWITAGKVMVVPAEHYWDLIDTGKYPFQGKTYPTTLWKDPKTGVTGLRMGGLIRGDKDCPWDQSVVGRWLGITEPSEVTPDGKKIRWWQILSCTVNADGTKDLTIQRFWWGAKEMGSPTLYRIENGTWDGHIRPLAYTIAPGSYVTDVARAVPTADNPALERTLGITPYADMNTKFDFEKGDAIEQAVGPDPFKPTPFRMWTWDNVPAVFPSPMLDLANNGADPRYAAMMVHGGVGNSDDVVKTYRQLPPWENVISMESACNIGFNFAADCTNAAILFKQPYHAQVIKWLYGKSEPGKPRAEATLTVSPDTGALTFTGGDFIVNGTVISKGAAPVTSAKPPFAKNVAVQKGAKSLTVTFEKPEATADYAVFLELSWLSNRAVSGKTANGFTITFDKAAPKEATLDWMVAR